MKTRILRATRPSTTDCCEHCGAGLLHELVTFEATTPETRWKLCADCVGYVVQQLAEADHEAEALLDDLWGLPPRQTGAA